MRLTRMTTRRLMIAVAVVGLLLGVVVGGWRLKLRRDYCLQQASNHARTEKFFRSIESRVASLPPTERPSIMVDGHTYQAATLAAYCAGRKNIYLHAASRPWLSVPPVTPPHMLVIRDPRAQVVFEIWGFESIGNIDVFPVRQHGAPDGRMILQQLDRPIVMM
jgi:hypothetical protein